MLLLHDFSSYVRWLQAGLQLGTHCIDVSVMASKLADDLACRHIPLEDVAVPATGREPEGQTVCLLGAMWVPSSQHGEAWHAGWEWRKAATQCSSRWPLFPSQSMPGYLCC